MANGEYESKDIEPGSALATINKQEINQQIVTAHQFPRFSPQRGVKHFQAEVLRLATADEEIAKSMFYQLKREGRNGSVTIEGPSVRMAEIVAGCWRNIHVMSRDGGIEDEYVVGQAVAWDLESNYRVGTEVRRRITTKNGRRYSDDMIAVTTNAAKSIAWRNAVFKIVPSALLKEALQRAKEVSVGKDLPMDKKRERAFKAMAEFGAKPEEVLRVLGRGSMLDVTIEDLIYLNGLHTAIKEGETTWKAAVAQSGGMAEVVRPPDDLPGGAFAKTPDAMLDPNAPIGTAQQKYIMERWVESGQDLNELEPTLYNNFQKRDLGQFTNKELPELMKALGI